MALRAVSGDHLFFSFFPPASIKGLIVCIAEPAAPHMSALKKCRSCITKHLADAQLHVLYVLRAPCERIKQDKWQIALASACMCDCERRLGRMAEMKCLWRDDWVTFVQSFL